MGDYIPGFSLRLIHINWPDSSTIQAAVVNVNQVVGLYTDNASAPLQAGAGLRQFYQFGLYNYCAYVEENSGICGNHTAGERFTPYDIIKADMISNYSILTEPIIPENTFRDSKYLGDSSKAAYWMILLGTVCAALALLTLVIPLLFIILTDESEFLEALQKIISHFSCLAFSRQLGACYC